PQRFEDTLRAQLHRGSGGNPELNVAGPGPRRKREHDAGAVLVGHQARPALRPRRVLLQPEARPPHAEDHQVPSAHDPDLRFHSTCPATPISLSREPTTLVRSARVCAAWARLSASFFKRALTAARSALACASPVVPSSKLSDSSLTSESRRCSPVARNSARSSRVNRPSIELSRQRSMISLSATESTFSFMALLLVGVAASRSGRRSSYFASRMARTSAAAASTLVAKTSRAAANSPRFAG